MRPNKPHQAPFWGVVMIVLCGPAVSAAASRASDPVEELRQALQTPVENPRPNSAELKKRQIDLENRTQALRGIGDLHRALALTDWRDEDLESAVRELDRQVREEVVKRLVDKFRALLDRGKTTDQLAAVILIGELGPMIRETYSPNPSFSRKGVLRRLAPDLVKLLQKGSPQVRTAAVQALSQVDPEPAVAVPALGNLLKEDDVVLRRAGVAGLGNLIKQIHQLVPVRGKSVTGVQAKWAEVFRMAATVVPQTAGGLADADAEVRRSCAEAIQAAALALNDYLFDPVQSGGLQPLDPRMAEEHKRSRRQEIDREVAAMKVLVRALADGAPALVPVLNDGDRGTCLAANQALEAVADARRRLLEKGDSIPGMVKGGGVDAKAADPLQEGLAKAVPI